MAKKTKVRRKRKQRNLPTAFPESFTTKLRYVERITLDAAALGAPVEYSFRANSIFDPNLTGVGHQPMGRDEFVALYDHYTVIGSRCKATFYPLGDYSPNCSMWVGGTLQDTTSTFTDLSEMLEQTGSNGRIINKLAANAPTVKLMKYSPRRMFKLGSGSIVGNSRIAAQTGANPDEDAVYTLFAIQPDGSSVDPIPISVLVEIEYIVVFTEKRTMNQS